MLVAHEGNFSVDLGRRPHGAARTSASSRRAGDVGGPPARPRPHRAAAPAVCSRASRPSAGDCASAATSLQLIANDRLRAPNDAQTLAALRPAVDALLTTLYGDDVCTVQHDPDPRQRLTVSVQASHQAGIADLLQRL